MRHRRPIHALLLTFAPVSAALFVTAAAQAPPPQMAAASGLLIRGGTVIDGTGAPGRRLDVRVSGDSIVEVGANLPAKPGERTIDATGRSVTPGFIDVHSHADRGIDETPDASTQVMQGITTAVVGQDGGGRLPVADFFADLERNPPSINYATQVGHGTVRDLVLGGDFKRAATAAELETMKALVDRGMKDGALGLSSGLEYDPGFYATPEELAAVASAIAPYGGYYSSHVRDEENHVMDAWREAIDVGRKARVRVEIAHMKVASKPVWGKAAEALKILEDAKREGVQVMGDWYPYTYWQSAMYVLIPDRDFENRGKWEVGLDEIGGAQNVRITNYRPDPSLNGKTVADVAAAWGKDPVTVIIEMIRAAGPGIGIIGTSMIEADLATIVAHPQALICSDGGLSGRHPRGYGAFPRVLARYVRDLKALSLEEAIAKMTGRSARQLGFDDRGLIAPGRKADLVVFDAAAIQDRGTPTDPAQSPVGLAYVIVNGQVVLDEGKMTAARPGRGLRRANWKPYAS